jgi:large subunit ribosomal protein L29
MKVSDLRKLDKDALVAKLKDLKEEEFNFKMQFATQQLPNYRQYYVTKRTIAKAKTVLTEMQKTRSVNSSKGKK